MFRGNANCVKRWLIIVVKERGGVNSMVLLTLPPELGLIRSSYIELPTHVTSAATVELYQH
jgi:hypothetical protein